MSSNWFDNWQTRVRKEEEEHEKQEEDDAQMRRNAARLVMNAATWLANEQLHQQPQWGGSVPGRAYIPRFRERADNDLMEMYFVRNSVFPAEIFRRRFRMRREVFLRLLDDVQSANPYFMQKPDRKGQLGFSPHMKVTCALRMLAYGQAADTLDEKFMMAESTGIENLGQFCQTIVTIYQQRYLRAPTTDDLNRLLHRAEKRGFPGMIGSLDCMHWQWKNCPTGWQGSFSGKSRKPTIVLEAVADFDTWIWHAFFGVPGAQNDITVLGRSPLFDDLVEGRSPNLDYYINNQRYNMGYYIADGIYPKWATLVQAIRHPENEAEEYFTTKQESYRKDVERAFGVLQARWAIIRQPERGWSTTNLSNIMLACIILYNMIVEDERADYCNEESDDDEQDPNRSRRARARIYDRPDLDYERDPRTGRLSMREYMARYKMIRSSFGHGNLQNDLVHHLCTMSSENHDCVSVFSSENLQSLSTMHAVLIYVLSLMELI